MTTEKRGSDWEFLVAVLFFSWVLGLLTLGFVLLHIFGAI